MPLPKLNNTSGKGGTLPSVDNVKINTESGLSGLPPIDSNNTENTEDNIDFQPMSYDEQEKIDIIEEQEEVEEPIEKRQYTPPKKTLEEKMPKYKDDEPILDDEEDKDKFINKKKKKIIPTGAKASRIKARDFDSRKNSLAFVKLIRLLFMLFVLFLFALGIKNTYFPVQIYTPGQIEQIALNAVGNTGFPLERGRALAQEFLKYYVNGDVKDIANQQILSTFYNGKYSDSNSYNSKKRDFVGVHQKAATDPILFEEYSISPYNGMYKFSVLLTDTDGAILGDDSRLKANWMSFAVNVYYNRDTDTMSIHPDSPTVIPTYKVTNNSIIPFEKPLGNGKVNDEMTKTLTPTIDGFILAFSKVTDKSHNEINQYIPADQPISLISGFGGEVKIAGTTKNAISKTAYNTDDPNIWKVDVRVNWVNEQVTGTSSVYPSRYVMTIQRTADDVYLVVKFAPYIYEMKDTN